MVRKYSYELKKFIVTVLEIGLMSARYIRGFLLYYYLVLIELFKIS